MRNVGRHGRAHHRSTARAAWRANRPVTSPEAAAGREPDRHHAQHHLGAELRGGSVDTERSLEERARTTVAAAPAPSARAAAARPTSLGSRIRAATVPAAYPETGRDPDSGPEAQPEDPATCPGARSRRWTIAAPRRARDRVSVNTKDRGEADQAELRRRQTPREHQHDEVVQGDGAALPKAAHAIPRLARPRRLSGWPRSSIMRRLPRPPAAPSARRTPPSPRRRAVHRRSPPRAGGPRVAMRASSSRSAPRVGRARARGPRVAGPVGDSHLFPADHLSHLTVERADDRQPGARYSNSL